MTYGAALIPPPGGVAERCAGNVKAAADLHSIVKPAGAGRPTGLSELSENEIQKAVFKHLRIRGAKNAFWFHPKNASADMAGRKAGIHFALGVEPGIPDVIVIKQWSIHAPGGPKYNRVYALELKRESRRGKKKTRHEMRQFLCRSALERCGVTVGIAYGLDEALAWLEQHGLLVGRAA